MRRALFLLLALLPLLPSCQTTAGGPMVEARNQTILAEPRGDFWIGRRYFVDKYASGATCAARASCGTTRNS